MINKKSCDEGHRVSANLAGLLSIVALLSFSYSLPGQSAAPKVGQEKPAPQRTILAVGAHAGDMEITAGAVLAKQAKAGDRIVFLHLSLGEGGNPRMSADEYGRQKRREAEEAASVIKAEVLFGPYKDGEIPNTEEGRRYVADVIRQVKPTHIISHWKNSLHKDHVAAGAITVDAVLLASLPGVQSSFPPHRGVRRLLFAENWEDAEDFHPYIYIDVSDAREDWEKCVTQYEFIRGGISSFPYHEYYRALFRIRGAEGGFTYAEAFDIEPWGKRQVYRSLP
jgi:LmbE family N-acetylglucosaminyl deacetylase